MEPDGTTRIIYWAPPVALKEAIERDRAAGIKAMLAKLTKELGEAPTFDIPLQTPRPKNWRPWHQHTLPNRRRR